MLSLKRKHHDHALIVRSLKSKNVIPFFKWLKHHQSTFYKIGWVYFYDQQDIEQAFLKTTVQASEKINDLTDSNFFEKWLLEIFFEILETDRIVSRKKDPSSPLKMKELLFVLDKTSRQMIVLTVYGNYTSSQVADLFEIPESKVKSNIYKSLKYIHACY